MGCAEDIQNWFSEWWAYNSVLLPSLVASRIFFFLNYNRMQINNSTQCSHFVNMKRNAISDNWKLDRWWRSTLTFLVGGMLMGRIYIYIFESSIPAFPTWLVCCFTRSLVKVNCCPFTLPLKGYTYLVQFQSMHDPFLVGIKFNQDDCLTEDVFDWGLL